MDLCVIEETRLAAANVDILTVKSKNGDVKDTISAPCSQSHATSDDMTSLELDFDRLLKCNQFLLQRGIVADVRVGVRYII